MGGSCGTGSGRPPVATPAPPSRRQLSVAEDPLMGRAVADAGALAAGAASGRPEDPHTGSAAAAGAEAMAAVATSPHDPLWPGPEPDGGGAHGLGPASSSPSHPASPPRNDDAACRRPPDHDLRRPADGGDQSSIDAAPQPDHSCSKAPHGAPSMYHPSSSTHLLQPAGVAGHCRTRKDPSSKGRRARSSRGMLGGCKGPAPTKGALNPPWGMMHPFSV